jgi:hypothetical protein
MVFTLSLCCRILDQIKRGSRSRPRFLDGKQGKMLHKIYNVRFNYVITLISLSSIQFCNAFGFLLKDEISFHFIRFDKKKKYALNTFSQLPIEKLVQKILKKIVKIVLKK